MPLTNINLSGPLLIPGIGLMSAPAGGLVRYVYQDASGNRASGLDQLPASMQDVSDASVAVALGKLRDNRGDTIVCLPGHVETIGGAAAWSLVKGVTIACAGNRADRATFNWTAAASQIAFNKDGVRLINANLNFAATAATTVTKACAVTAATIFERCKFTFGASGTQTCTTGIEFATGADGSVIDGCVGFGTANCASNPVTIVNAIDQLEVRRTTIICGTSATGQGVIQASAAATNWMMDDCGFANTITSSTAAVVGFAGITGMWTYVMAGITSATGGATAIATPGNVMMDQCYGGVVGKNGIAITPASG